MALRVNTRSNDMCDNHNAYDGIDPLSPM